jgi:hypothetical protein
MKLRPMAPGNEADPRAGLTGRVIRVPHRRVNPGPQRTAKVNLAGPTSWSSLARPARTHPANVPDKDEVPGSSPGRPTTQHHRSERRGRRSCSGPCSRFGPCRALLGCASFFSPGAPGRPWAAVPYPGGWAGSSRRHGPEAAAAAQPPWGPVPARPASVGVTVVEGGRRCSRLASGPRPNRCTKSAPWRRRSIDKLPDDKAGSLITTPRADPPPSGS